MSPRAKAEREEEKKYEDLQKTISLQQSMIDNMQTSLQYLQTETRAACNAYTVRAYVYTHTHTHTHTGWCKALCRQSVKEDWEIR